MGDLSRLFQARTAKKEAANCRFFQPVEKVQQKLGFFVYKR